MPIAVVSMCSHCTYPENELIRLTASSVAGTARSSRFAVFRPLNLMDVPVQSSSIAGYAVVGIMAPHLRDQLGMLLGDPPMPIFPAPVDLH